MTADLLRELSPRDLEWELSRVLRERERLDRELGALDVEIARRTAAMTGDSTR